jgi:two-component system chemotaxis response regulator CheB
MSRARIRVLVAEDSLTIRKRLCEVLGSDRGLEVVGEAADGGRAIEMCRSLRPDVMTLDMMMPVMSGLAVTEYVMAFIPTPILVVSASVNRGEIFKTFDALAAGAVDVLDKPTGTEPAEAWEKKLIAQVKLVSRIKVITHPRGRLSLWDDARLPAAVRTVRPAAARAETAGDRGPAPRLVAIGASTGGPSAITAILRGLPVNYPLPILFVIHIGKPFGASFADWLDGQSPIRVSMATDRQPLPPPGRPSVVIAPPDLHLVVEGGYLRLLSTPERHSCRPSVDVLFESLAREMGERVVACLLTGMGRDGADGLLALRRRGALTFAQDEQSSVVWGMPREAITLGAAQRVLALDEFAAHLVEAAEVKPP